jgi:glyoxylase-like metal-dependent hydrolase (beta-lactamase superfamily II)
LREAHYHSDEGDLIVYMPDARFLMAVDTLAPGYVPFMGFDITSNFHEYLKVFDTLLQYEFDVFVGGHLTHPGDRRDVELAREFTLDVLETTRRIHNETDLMVEFTESAKEIGNFDNKYLLFKRFLDVVTARATAELEPRWINRLAGVDVFTADHVRTALIYVRWDD